MARDCTIDLSSRDGIKPSTSTAIIDDTKWKIVVLLRWLVIITTAVLVLFHAKGEPLDKSSMTLILGLIASNIALTFIPKHTLNKNTIYYLILLLDTLVIGFCVYMIGLKNTDFYIVYFMLILLACSSGRLKWILMNITIVCILYGVIMYYRMSASELMDTSVYMRIPLLFIVAIFHSLNMDRINNVDKENSQLKSTVKTIQNISTNMDHQSLLFMTAQGVSNVFNSIQAIVLSLDSDGRIIDTISSDEGSAKNVDEVILSETIHEHLSLDSEFSIGDLTEGKFYFLGKDGKRALVPLSVQDKTLHVMVLEKEGPDSIDVHETGMINEIIETAISGLKNANLMKDTKTRAIVDFMTGLYNHIYFQNRLRQELKRSSRLRYPVFLLFIDLDNFKQINDTMGHQSGDDVLKKLAKIFKKEVRENDIIARYGGDEFAIILPDTERDSALYVAERIRESVVEIFTEMQPGVSVSIGIAGCPLNTTEEKKLVLMADQALYMAKYKGKNQVCLSSCKENEDIWNDESIEALIAITVDRHTGHDKVGHKHAGKESVGA